VRRQKSGWIVQARAERLNADHRFADLVAATVMRLGEESLTSGPALRAPVRLFDAFGVGDMQGCLSLHKHHRVGVGVKNWWGFGRGDLCPILRL
jgi:hypothetical protein